MITIGIHGLNFQEAHKLRAKIFEEIKDKRYASGTTVEIYLTDTLTIGGTARPYLRLATNCGEYAYEMLNFLQDFTEKHTNPKMSVGYSKLSEY